MSIKQFSRSRDGTTRITPNFLIREFASNCGTDVIMLDTRLPPILERIRELCGNKSVRISSANRSLAHNRSIGSKDTSNHVKGGAADITIAGVENTIICRAAETALREAGIPGELILYTGRQNFVHVAVDWQGRRYRGINDGTLRNAPGWEPLPATPKQATPQSPPATAPTFKQYQIRVRLTDPNSFLHIRSSPSNTSNSIGRLKHGDTRTVIEEANGTAVNGDTVWLKVAGVVTGWISRNLTFREQ